LLDASTGRLIRKLGHTFQLGGLMLKSDDKQPGRTWVGEVDPSDGALHAVGSLDTAAPFGCSVQGHYLACPTSSGPTTVWKVP
jgi:outer membrane protein assembly factor BamB